ncbi:MAG: single-stranded DNA-binding protein [Fimbriimonadales bacterium]|nr:single-stranded DNA-binding protein [Fimbriimonadales bacterium]MDW8052343.1 single-stranded DNA-binding protein [Armatimonadota bacterium]
MYYNRVILVGRLTRDPELRATADGMSVVRFTLAVDRPTRAGEERQADFFDVVAFRQLADTIANYMTKGRLVLVEGRLQTRRYTDREGNPRRAFEILADNVRFLERREVEPEPTTMEEATAVAAPRTVQRPTTATPTAPAYEDYEPNYDDIDYIPDLGETIDDLPDDPFR